MTTLHIHHHRRGDTTSDPLSSRSREVLHGAHIARDTRSDEASSGTTKGIAVVSIEVRRHSAATFVAEEVRQRRELPREATFSLPSRELGSDHLSQELFGLDERHLYVAVWVTVEGQLTSDRSWQAGIESRVSSAEVLDDVGTLVSSRHRAELCFVVSQIVVELSDECLEGRDEFDQTFGDEHRTEVLTLSRTSRDDFSDVGHYVVKGQVLSLYFFADDRDIRLYLQGAFEGDVRSRATHQLDEVPVLAS